MGTAARHSDDRTMVTLTEIPSTGADLWAHPFIAAAVDRRHPGLVVRAWREAHWPDRIPQDRAARILGVSQGTLSHWETSDQAPHGPREWDGWFDLLGAPAHLRWWRAEEDRCASDA